jgi:hypothetical protein
MKLNLWQISTAFFIFSVSGLSAAPLLLVNYNMTQTNFAESRAEALGLTYQRVADFTSPEQLKGKSVVIMPGFLSYANLLNQSSILSEFVQEGGYLWINVAGTSCAADVAPGGVDYAHDTCGGAQNQSETIVDSGHAYISGSFDARANQLSAADFMNWNVTDIGHVAALPANATVITRNAQGPTLAEYSFGQGWVVVSTLTYGWGPSGGARGVPVDNMLLYAANQARSAVAADPVVTPETATPEPGSLFLSAGAMLLGVSRLIRRG